MKGYPFKSSVNKTISCLGSFNTGTKSIPLTKTTAASKPGWNLVGNSYTSEIDWEATGWMKTKLFKKNIC